MSVLSARKKAKAVFMSCGGQLRMRDAIKHGINRYMLYTLRDQGEIEQVSRGVYRLVDLPPMQDPDLVTISLRFPKTVICLLSALAYHKLTTQIPHRVSVAVSRNSNLPTLNYPPLTVYRFSDKEFHAGIETHQIDGVPVHVYDPEKTIADCFKFRNRIGMDVVLEALQFYKSGRQVDYLRLLKYAKTCRVENVMKPYLEAIL